MDFKVYTKEEVKQPSGTAYIVTPNIIDIYPETDSEDTSLLNAEILTSASDVLEQECALATIWQRGLDPLDLDDGIRWSEALLGEINIVQLQVDIAEAVANVTDTVTVVFDVVTDDNGNQYMTYTLQAVA